ncbi:MAG: hypothetical protein ACLU6B_10555 [Lachnospirales bacterium]
MYAAERSVRPRNLAAAYNSEGAQYFYTPLDDLSSKDHRAAYNLEVSRHFYTPLVDLSGRDLTAAYKISNK